MHASLTAHGPCVLADDAPIGRPHPQRAGSAATLTGWLAQQGFPGPFARAEDGETALMRAAWLGNTAATATLLGRGLPVDAEDDQGRTALWYACLQGWPATIVQLLQAGADIDHADDDGLTCLMQAAASGRAELMALLRQLGASTAPCAPDGRAAADMAADRARELLRHARRLSA
ncbi:ankyrin repeat domain-containing protein [Pseudacidovorax intermedius]|uniref:ankyrin repeat domain-containing protein n=1 Tax=Pseudacidovorax intermedius TaxID=433924 RepID=UPI0026EF7199|nr:ankyrin repeat domain-containing protein [Pseudacidovorax intermedius]